MADGQQPMAITEHHLTVSRTARYAVLGGRDGAVEELWMVCHGYGQRAARFIRHFEPIATEHHRIVAPEALSRFYLELPDPAAHSHGRVGASWMTREDRQAEINDYVEYLNALWRQLRGSLADGARLTVLGFSQGVATAVRWTALGDATPSRLVLWAGSFPRDVLASPALGKLRTVPMFLIAGTTDHIATDDAIGKELAELDAAGLDPAVVRFEGGHAIDAEVLKRLLNS
jgi:predicted esterase